MTVARVTPYRDGPYLLRGPFELIDQDGNVIATRRATIALCRCGRSQTQPFCDGTHKLIDFQADSGAERSAPGRPSRQRTSQLPAADPPSRARRRSVRSECAAVGITTSP